MKISTYPSIYFLLLLQECINFISIKKKSFCVFISSRRRKYKGLNKSLSQSREEGRMQQMKRNHLRRNLMITEQKLYSMIFKFVDPLCLDSNRKTFMSIPHPQVHFRPISKPYFEKNKPPSIFPNPHKTVSNSTKPSTPQLSKLKHESQLRFKEKQYNEKYPAESQQHSLELQSKQKIDGMNEDLEKLKKQLDMILKQTNEKKKYYQERRNNRSFNSLYVSSKKHSLESKTPEVQKIPNVQGVKIISSIQQSKRERIKTETSIKTVAKKRENKIKQIYEEVIPQNSIPKSDDIFRQKEGRYDQTNSIQQTKNYEQEILRYEKKIIQYEQTIEKINYSLETLSRENIFWKEEVKVKTQKIQQLQNKIKFLMKGKEQAQEKQNIWKQRLNHMESQLVQIKGTKNSDFEVLLKSQIAEIAQFKQILQRKNEEISHLNELILVNRIKTEDSINDANLNKLKYLSQLKNNEQKFEITLLNKENEIKTLKQTFTTIEGKLQAAIREVKTKDEFIKNYLVGRTHSENEKQYIKTVFQQYQINFSEKDLLEKLLEEQKLIEQLRKELSLARNDESKVG